MTWLNFAPSDEYSLGVELEFQLVNKTDCKLVPLATKVVADMPEAFAEKTALEFLQSIVELRTGVCGSVDEVAADLRRTILAGYECADRHDCLLFSGSLHPFADPDEQVLSFGSRYQRIMRELQYVGRQFICQGLHIHIGMSNRERAVKVCDTMQPYLPVLLALSCSSPYFRGNDTGFASYRTKLFEVLPLAGITDFHGSWSGVEQKVAMLRDHQIIDDFRDLWWDVRPSPAFGTVEIRICDLPVRFPMVLGLVALVQALVRGLAEGLVPHEPVSLHVMSYNKWQAARHGLDGDFVDPLGLLGKRRELTMKKAVTRMVQALQPVIKSMGTEMYIASLVALALEGTGADHQRRLVNSGYDFPDMIRNLHNRFW